MNLVNELERLAELFRTGAISEAEYGQAKSLLFNNTEAKEASSTPSSPEAQRVIGPVASRSGPEWMKACGWVVTLMGLVGFAAVGYANRQQGQHTAGLVAGLLNRFSSSGLRLGSTGCREVGSCGTYPRRRGASF